MQSLVEKYRPRKMDDFAGLHKQRAILGQLAASPYESAWLLIGDSGTGKTTLGLALAEAMGAEIQHIPSRQCDLETVERVCDRCHYIPFGGGWWFVLVDECDQMSKAAQHAFLSKLDSTQAPPNTVFVFTANTDKGLEDRFLSRCRVLRFEGSGSDVEALALLTRVWNMEAPNAPVPDLAGILADARGNIRAALMSLELELLTVPQNKPAPKPEPVQDAPKRWKWVEVAGGRMVAVEV